MPRLPQINEDIEKYINNESGVQVNFCWEAATGHGFTGHMAHCDTVVTFKEEGGIDHSLVLDSPEKAGKVLAKGNNFYASFKSSGSSAPYLALRTRRHC